MRSLILALAAATALAGAADATDYSLTLTGDVSTASSGSFVGGNGSTYYVGSLDLSGFTPFTLQQGDTITATITLANGPYAIGSFDNEFLGLNFTDMLGTGAVNASNTGTFAFDGSSTTVETNCGNCLSALYYTSNLAYSFSALASFTTVVTLDVPYTVDAISLSYQLNNNVAAVPEPAAWALMVTGFGAIGGALRTSRRKVAAA